MNKETILQLIGKSELNEFQKKISSGFIERAYNENDKHKEDVKLILSVGGVKCINELVLSTDELKVYTVRPGKDEKDWDTVFPYRAIFLNKKGNWQMVDTVCHNLDTVLLNYLQYKHLGANDCFADHALKILEITVPEV